MTCTKTYPNIKINHVELMFYNNQQIGKGHHPAPLIGPPNCLGAHRAEYVTLAPKGSSHQELTSPSVLELNMQICNNQLPSRIRYPRKWSLRTGRGSAAMRYEILRTAYGGHRSFVPLLSPDVFGSQASGCQQRLP